MALTSIKNEPCRVRKQMQEMTDQGRYMNNVPGPGAAVCFFEDPQVRLQKWGANLHTNSINLESDLLGLSRNLNQDCIKENNYLVHKTSSTPIKYGTCLPYTEESRAIMPAWTVLDMEQNRWDYLPLNPQENVCYPFQNNLSTRILEKDYYKTKWPCVNDF